MNSRRNLILGGGMVALFGLLAVGQAVLEARVQQQDMITGPRFAVDPYWPKPLPNGWILGTVIGVAVDAQDHVYIVHRGVVGAEAGADLDPPTGECCSSAPPILQFDPAGNLVRAWGGPSPTGEFVWPNSNHGLGVDMQGNVWIGGNVGTDSHVLKFTQDGRYLATYGEPGQDPDSHSMTHFGRVADIEFDFAANEAYFADGYGNRRVAVVDMDSGEIKRYWGAYGNAPDDNPVWLGNRAAGQNWLATDYQEQQFRGPVHCAEPSNDGLLYVCDRQNNRVQVFRFDGTYVTEGYYAPDTLGDGATWDLDFSPDAEQRYIYIADGKNSRVRIVERATLEEIGTLGTGGRYPGMFQAAHSLATDSQGNIFVTETYEGRRLHKFVYLGVGQTPRDQGATWNVR